MPFLGKKKEPATPQAPAPEPLPPTPQKGAVKERASLTLNLGSEADLRLDDGRYTQTLTLYAVLAPEDVAGLLALTKNGELHVYVEEE